MEVKISISTDNAAFEYSPATEVARILRQLANNIQESNFLVVGQYQGLRDINGNVVGKMETEDAN